METEKPTPEYLKGFNQGYMIGRDLPEISSSMRDLRPDSEQSKGFIDGKKWALIEKTKEKGLNKTNKERTSEIVKDKGKDDLEPE